MVRAAQTLSRQYPEGLGSLAADVTAAELELAEATKELDTHATQGISGPAHEHAQGRQLEASTKLKTVRDVLLQAHRAAANALVATAESGEETARAELERLTLAVPHAFKRGFAQAIRDAQYRRARLAELVAALNPP
jgi:hypothetical protein